MLGGIGGAVLGCEGKQLPMLCAATAASYRPTSLELLR